MLDALFRRQHAIDVVVELLLQRVELLARRGPEFFEALGAALEGLLDLLLLIGSELEIAPHALGDARGGWRRRRNAAGTTGPPRTTRTARATGSARSASVRPAAWAMTEWAAES
jgi:hypothetical protein